MTNTADFLAQKIEDKREAMLVAIKLRDPHAAGANAAHLVCFQNALARTKSGATALLINDPFYSRFFSINQYFRNAWGRRDYV